MSRKKVKHMPRDQQKAVFWKMSQIQNKHSHRSKQSQAVDRGITARKVYTGRDRKGKARWMKHPNQVDMKNVDTRVAKAKYKSKKSKESMKQQRKDLGKTKKNVNKSEEKKKRLAQAKKDLHEQAEKTKNAWHKREQYDTEKGETESDAAYWKRINYESSDKETKEKLKELEREEQIINKDIERQLAKQRQQEKELKDTQVKHTQRKKLIKDTPHGRGYSVLSQSQVDEIENLTPTQRENLVKDVDKWYSNRKHDTSLTPEEKQEIDRINKKYEVESGLGAYYGITGKYPKGPKHKTTSYQRRRPADHFSSGAEHELDNVVKLDQLRKSISSTESKQSTIKGLESDIERGKKYYTKEKTELDRKGGQMSTASERKQLKNLGSEIEKNETKLIYDKRRYNKYVDNQRKKINKLKQDPNIEISARPTEGDTTLPTSDVILEYKGDYVNSKKVVRNVDNSILKEYNIKREL